jgi:hypothetical protein
MHMTWTLKITLHHLLYLYSRIFFWMCVHVKVKNYCLISQHNKFWENFTITVNKYLYFILIILFAIESFPNHIRNYLIFSWSELTSSTGVTSLRHIHKRL